jgi:hypothetical protein
LVSIYHKRGGKIRSNTLNLPTSNLVSRLALRIKQQTTTRKSG